jgi:hypothetical protein
VYRDLFHAAKAYDAAISASFTAQEREILDRCLVRIAAM